MKINRKITKLFVFAFAMGIAALATVTMGRFTAPANASHVAEVISECDIVRQAENTPPTNAWVLYTRTPASIGAFVNGPANPPIGDGSLQFITPTGGDKVFLFNYEHVNTPLSSITALSYSTYRDTASTASANQVPAINIQVDYNGAAPGGFTTLVFEPVYNSGQGPIVPGAWQDWDAFGSGIWWSTQPINGMCAGATTTCWKSWSYIVANNPNATILGGFGVNQGSGNGG